MNRTGKRILVSVMAFGLAFGISPYLPGAGSMAVVEAHHGASHHSEGTNDYYYCGGHEAHHHEGGECPYTDYYCGGHEAHRHTGGVCPYADAAVSSDVSGAISKDTVKEIQQALSDQGYTCGKADGIWGRKSKKALKCYQEDHKMTADGCISHEVLKAFEIEE